MNFDYTKDLCNFKAEISQIMGASLSEYINLSWIYWGLMAVYGITILSVIGIVLSENRNPVKSLAWVTVLLVVPVFGLILYIFFGRSIKNKHIISRRNRRKLRKYESMSSPKIGRINLSVESLQQIKLGKALTGANYYPGNDAKILTSGKEKFDELKRDLKAAQHYINLQYYIFEDDNIGNEIKNILIEKARSGVKVRVIYDHVGCFGVKNRFFKEMRDAGVMVYPFFRVAFPPFATRINWRNHRKLCVIDGRIGYIGGMNIADRYINGTRWGKWSDTHLRIQGPAVAALNLSFAVDWSFMGQPLIEEGNEVATPVAKGNTMGMQMITSGPTSQWSNIAMVYLKAIANAKKCVYVQTPYFLPTESLLKALQSAALSRVDVRIMLPRRSDSIMLKYASYSYIAECLRAGIKIYLYEPGMLHSKTMIIDDEFSTVGSTNFDFRSFEHNFEGNMFIYSHGFNQSMKESFFSDLCDCSRIKPSEWRHRSITQKALESFMRLFSPIL